MKNTTGKSKCHRPRECHHYVPSFCNWVYLAVFESREIWAHAPEWSKIKYPDISAKEEAKRKKKKFLINGRSLASNGASWCRWEWGSGSNLMCSGITDAEYGSKATWRRCSLEYFTEPRLSIHPFFWASHAASHQPCGKSKSWREPKLYLKAHLITTIDWRVAVNAFVVHGFLLGHFSSVLSRCAHM